MADPPPPGDAQGSLGVGFIAKVFARLDQKTQWDRLNGSPKMGWGQSQQLELQAELDVRLGEGCAMHACVYYADNPRDLSAMTSLMTCARPPMMPFVALSV